MQAHPTQLLAEGLVAFRVPVPSALAGHSLSAAAVPDTGCTLVAIVQDGHGLTDFDPDTPLPADGDLVLVGDLQAEERFYARFITDTGRSSLRARLERLLRHRSRATTTDADDT